MVQEELIENRCPFIHGRRRRIMILSRLCFPTLPDFVQELAPHSLRGFLVSFVPYAIRLTGVLRKLVASTRSMFLTTAIICSSFSGVSLYSQEIAGAIREFPFGLQTSETRRIEGRDQLPRETPQFFLSDNSTIALSPSIREWTLISNETYIGENATITIDWLEQEPAESGTPGSSGNNCHTGGSGSPGQRGFEGQNGPYINLDLGVVHAWGSLTIDVSGQPGQDGGKGGRGGNGGRADVSELCKGGTGGNSGSGGDGGGGGNGGIVIITWSAPATLKPDELKALESHIRQNLVVRVGHGPGGQPGIGGDRGDGGPSRCSDWGLFKICRGSGQRGQKGNPGTAGAAGGDGELTLIRVE